MLALLETRGGGDGVGAKGPLPLVSSDEAVVMEGGVGKLEMVTRSSPPRSSTWRPFLYLNRVSLCNVRHGGDSGDGSGKGNSNGSGCGVLYE